MVAESEDNSLLAEIREKVPQELVQNLNLTVTERRIQGLKLPQFFTPEQIARPPLNSEPGN